MDKFYYCRGNNANPNGVIQALEEQGGINSNELTGYNNNTLYYIDCDNTIVHLVKCALYEMMLKFGTELTPIPKKKAKTFEELENSYGTYITNGNVSNTTYISRFTSRYKAGYAYATEKLAKHAIAEAKISQILANGYYEIQHNTTLGCFIIRYRFNEGLVIDSMSWVTYQPLNLLRFKTYESAEEFVAYNEQLVKDYLMID